MRNAIATKNFIVAATPRTGSGLLCEGLEATGVAGRPAEVFAPHLREHWCRYWSLDAGAAFAEYLDAAMCYGTTSNGVYGLKIQQMHIDTVAREASLVSEHFTVENDNVLEFLFPCAMYIWTVRRDRRAQAISFYRALATNEWWRRATEEEQSRDFRLPPGAVAPPAFDADAIRAQEAELARQSEAWASYFFKRGITPLVIEYETLTQDYRGEIARALSFLGLPSSVVLVLPPPRLVRQADEVTERWRGQLEAVDQRGRQNGEVAPQHRRA